MTMQHMARNAGGDTADLSRKVAEAQHYIEAFEQNFVPITVPQFLDQQATAHCDICAINILERGETASFAELQAASVEYAQALRDLGVQKGDRVALMLQNRIEFVHLWFAIARIGAVMVPMNFRYTPREIEFVLSDTGAKFAFADAEVIADFCAAAGPLDTITVGTIIVVGGNASGVRTLDQVLAARNDAPITSDVAPDDLLSIQYTSGTTGFPKGCMLTHTTSVTFSYQSTIYENPPFERCMSANPFFYVSGQSHLMKTLRHGKTLFMAPRFSSSNFLQWLQKHKIEWCEFPALVLRQPDAAGAKTSLRKVHCFSGWTAEAIAELRDKLGVPCTNNYGMTETSWITQMPEGFEGTPYEGAFGLRAPLREIRLVGDDGQTVPAGEVGEAWVRGTGMFQGYWNNQEANAELIQDGWFKTGDLLKQDDLGFYWLVGRKKDMIRRSGENIAAREVEAVIREIDEIADVAAIPVKDSTRGEEVKIVIELKPGLTRNVLPIETIMTQARDHLAAFKRPRYIVFIDELPRTPSSGKVLKRDLVDVPEPLAGCFDTDLGEWL
jgi:acyl-CoA synthetase (AMP-forming)/AMP-acid ligase II